jgi:histidinol-phosphate aminotransferase
VLFRSLHHYPDGEAYSLRQALARHLDLKPDQVRVGNGADGIIREVCVAFLEDEDEVIVSRSSFPVFDLSARVMRAKLVKTPLKDFGLDLAAMLQAITDRTKIIFVCNPNNPTGTIVQALEVDRFVARVPEHVLIVFDEAFYEYVDSPEYPDSLSYIRDGRSNVMTMRTFSKAYGITGIRLGYAAAHPELLTLLRAGGEALPVNRLAQVAGEAALEDREFLRRTVELNGEERLFLYRQFDRLGLDYVESHTNFILVELGPKADTIIQMLRKDGILMRSGKDYSLAGFARITIRTPAENASLIQALERVLQIGRAHV